MTMFELVWKEKVMGMVTVRRKTFPNRMERFQFIMQLEKSPTFVKVLDMN